MTRLRLELEHAPTPQARTEIEYHGGQFVVGRGAEADWRIDDPEKYVSRKHFVLSEEGADVVAIDASSDGLYVDGGSTPVGVGNSVKLEDGMRLRFGDFVAKVELTSAEAASAPEEAQPDAAASPFAFRFEPPEERAPPPERPESMPKPFGVRAGGQFDRPAEAEKRKPPRPLDDEDPFALDLQPRRSEQPAEPASPKPSGGYFDTGSVIPPPRTAEPEPEEAPKPERRAEDPVPDPSTTDRPGQAVSFEMDFAPAGSQTKNDRVETRRDAAPAREGPAPSESALRAAFFRGLGLDPERVEGGDAEAEMEALGRRLRDMTSGLVHLLRSRSQARQKARVAQTIIGASDVNPLKFTVTTDEALIALVGEPRAGYLAPDAAIEEAFRDLIDHEMRTWAAVQAALRKMVDKFDPAEFEAELEETGLLERLAAGGRNAKLWQLYNERYREIATAAEERFLGEIGADFRDAYERREGSGS